MFSVNKQTGEILGVYEYAPMTPITQEEKDYYKYSSVSPVSATHKDQVDDYMKFCIDKRKLVTYNNTNNLHDAACGIGVRNKVKSVFTLPQYKTMNKLIKGLSLCNVVIGSKAEIAKILVCEQKNILRTLKPVSNLVRIQTEGMAKGQMKILVHPAYGYKHQSDVINASRNACVRDWVRTQQYVGGEQEQEVVLELVFTEKLDLFLTSLKKGAANKRSYQLEEMGVETKPSLGIQEQLFIQDYYAGTKDSEYSR